MHFEDAGIQLDFYALFRPKEITKTKTAFIMYAPTRNTTWAEVKSSWISTRCCWLVVKLINGGVYQTLLFKGPNRFPGNTRQKNTYILYIKLQIHPKTKVTCCREEREREVTWSSPQETLAAVKVHPCVSPFPVHCI